jgi:hypothetical protein
MLQHPATCLMLYLSCQPAATIPITARKPNLTATLTYRLAVDLLPAAAEHRLLLYPLSQLPPCPTRRDNQPNCQCPHSPISCEPAVSSCCAADGCSISPAPKPTVSNTQLLPQRPHSPTSCEPAVSSCCAADGFSISPAPKP